MRLQDPVATIRDHAELINVGIDDHHDAPENIEVSNTSQVVFPLPGDPGEWDIPLPDDANIVMFTFRSANVVQNGGARAGVLGVATSHQFACTTMTLGGHGSAVTTAYNMCYSSPASALNLSDKIFDNAGADISLTACYIEGAAGSRVLHTEWTNYSAGLRTLSVYGEVAVIG